MLTKIKGLMHVKELIDEIVDKTNKYNENISSMKTEIDGLKNEIAELKSAQKGLLSELKSGLGGISDVREKMNNELYEFGLLKSKIQNKILEKFEEELQKELKVNLEKLKEEHGNYENARKELALVARNTGKLSEELNKVIEISKSIKKEDFELTKFYDKITKEDKEKLELMKKIDTLERLISKMRRSNNQ